MPTPDEQFERYLKQFRPLAPESLPIEKHKRASRRRIVFATWIAAAAVVLVTAVLTIRSHPKPSHALDGAGSVESVELITNTETLTVGSANALLAHARSVKAAVDLLAFRSHATPLPKGTHSALAVLSQEKTKL